MEIVGYVGAIIIGVILGLIGGGGSILTVPIFVLYSLVLILFLQQHTLYLL